MPTNTITKAYDYKSIYDYKSSAYTQLKLMCVCGIVKQSGQIMNGKFMGGISY